MLLPGHALPVVVTPTSHVHDCRSVEVEECNGHSSHGFNPTLLENVPLAQSVEENPNQ